MSSFFATLEGDPLISNRPIKLRSVLRMRGPRALLIKNSFPNSQTKCNHPSYSLDARGAGLLAPLCSTISTSTARRHSPQPLGASETRCSLGRSPALPEPIRRNPDTNHPATPTPPPRAQRTSKARPATSERAGRQPHVGQLLLALGAGDIGHDLALCAARSTIGAASACRPAHREHLPRRGIERHRCR